LAVGTIIAGAVMMHVRYVIGLTVLFTMLSACASVPGKSVAVNAGCSDLCLTPCPKGELGQADGNSAQDWDALALLTLDYADKLRACEVQRQACVKCLDRLREAGVIQ